MATGSLVGVTCYESIALATDAYFSGLPPFSFASGTNTVTNAYAKFPLGWAYKQTSVTSLGVTTTNFNQYVLAPPFPACYAPSEAFVDGVNVGWALVLALGAAYGVYLLTGLFKHG